MEKRRSGTDRQIWLIKNKALNRKSSESDYRVVLEWCLWDQSESDYRVVLEWCLRNDKKVDYRERSLSDKKVDYRERSFSDKIVDYRERSFPIFNSDF